MTVGEQPASDTQADDIRVLLDRAVQAVNAGDLPSAHGLAERVLEEDSANREAADLLATGEPPRGELRRLTIMVCDLVGSTELSERLDPERYHALVDAYKQQARKIIEGRYDGHIDNVKGDGIFSLFGFPVAHEEDATRAVKAALEVCRVVRDLSAQAMVATGEPLSVRAAVHRGLVFIDSQTGEVYGLAANVASRLEGVAEPGQVVISQDVRTLVANRFQIEPRGDQSVKGVAKPLSTFAVLRELPETDRLRWAATLVGRDAELAALRAAWRGARDAVADATNSVLLLGEPGVGKSRLAAELADEARNDGGRVLELLGSSFHPHSGFHPVRRLLESRCGIGPSTLSTERLALLRHELAAVGQAGEDVVTPLALALGLPASTGFRPPLAEGRKLNEEIAAAARQYLLACLGPGPAMLVAENLHWFDDSTLALLADLAAGASPGLLVVMTSRVAPAVSARMTLTLPPLSRELSELLVDELTEGRVDARTRAAVVARSDGIPLYVEELLRSGAPTFEGRPGAVPDVLYEPLVARLYTTVHGVPTAAAAAAIGRRVDRALLAAVLDLAPEDLDAELDALVSGDVLQWMEPEGAYWFRHELLREVAYELQPTAQRREVHGRVADLMVGRAGEVQLIDWPVVAGHYAQARRHRDAAHAYERAADLARSRGSFTEARHLLGRAIDLLDDLPDDRERMQCEVGLRLRRGFLAMSAEAVGSPDAASDFARCLELALIDATGDEMFSTLISLWAYHLSRAELSRARQVGDTLRTALTGQREYFLAANRAGNGMIQWFEGDFCGALTTLEDAVADLQDDSSGQVDSVWFVPNDPTASMHTHLALARFMAGDTVGAQAQLARAGEVTADLDFPQGQWSRAYAAWLGAWVCLEKGSLADAAHASDGLVGLANRHGFDGWTMIGMTHQAAVAAVEATADRSDVGRASASDHAATLSALVDLWQASELLVFLPCYLTIAAAALAAGGDVAAARQRCHAALRLGERTGMRFYEAETRRHLAVWGDDDVAIAADLEAALALALEQGARPFELRIALDLESRGVPGGRAALAAAVAKLPDDADLADLARARSRLNHTG